MGIQPSRHSMSGGRVRGTLRARVTIMPTLTTVNVTSKSTLIFGGQGSAATPIQLINQDANNTVYLAYASNPAIGQPGVMPLGPGASLAFDGSISVWGVTPAELTAAVAVIPGGSNYRPRA